MRLLRSFSIFFLVLVASTVNSISAYIPYTKEVFLDVWTGYRQDELSWNVRNNAVTPETNNKVKWKDISSWQLGLEQRVVTCNNIYFRARESYGWMFDGDAHHRFDGTTSLAANYNSGDDGYVFDLNGGVGYQFNFFCDTFKLAPLVGYAYNGQGLRLDRGTGDATILFPNNSKYSPRWYGPWVGFDMQYDVNCNFNLLSEFEYHWARLHASGNFPLLASDPSGFKDRGDADGYTAALAANYNLCDCWTVGLKGRYDYMKTRKNPTQTRVLANVGTVGLPNHVRWQEWSISVLLGRTF